MIFDDSFFTEVLEKDLFCQLRKYNKFYDKPRQSAIIALSCHLVSIRYVWHVISNLAIFSYQHPTTLYSYHEHAFSTKQ